jgi:Ca2+-binding RTX toxin-like protein
MIANNFPAALAPFNEDGSNDPNNPTRLTTETNDIAIWIEGTVSAEDPDYFYIPVPAGSALSAITLQSYQSTDAIAWYALQEGEKFSAGTDISRMLVGRHMGPSDIGKNLLPVLSAPITTGVVLWVNQTGAEARYVFSAEFSVLNGPDIIGTGTADTLTGTNAPERIFGFGGDDTMTGGLRADTIHGGDGIDVAVYQGARENYTITRVKEGELQVSYSGPIIAIWPPPPTEGIDTLIDVERIAFNDATIAYGQTRNAAQAYRIYKAAFNRTPDNSGLGYWIAQMDKGMDVVSVAARFIDSSEFRSLYRQNPTDAEFLTKVYSNVLARSPDAAGLAWWVNEMKTNPAKTWQKVLADFAESTENQANVASLIANGIEYAPWTG